MIKLLYFGVSQSINPPNIIMARSGSYDRFRLLPQLVTTDFSFTAWFIIAETESTDSALHRAPNQTKFHETALLFLNDLPPGTKSTCLNYSVHTLKRLSCNEIVLALSRSLLLVYLICCRQHDSQFHMFFSNVLYAWGGGQRVIHLQPASGGMTGVWPHAETCAPHYLPGADGCQADKMEKDSMWHSAELKLLKCLSPHSHMELVQQFVSSPPSTDNKDWLSNMIIKTDTGMYRYAVPLELVYCMFCGDVCLHPSVAARGTVFFCFFSISIIGHQLLLAMLHCMTKQWFPIATLMDTQK